MTTTTTFYRPRYFALASKVVKSCISACVSTRDSTVNRSGTMFRVVPGVGFRPALLFCAVALLATQPMPAAMAHSNQGHAKHAENIPAGYTRSVSDYDVPDVTLVDAAGEAVALRSLLEPDGPLMMNFIFTSCAAVCPVLSATFSQAQQQLASTSADLRMVSISIDPEHDTPERLREYAARFGAGAGWRFLTGDLADILSVQRGFDAFRGDKTNHVPLTYLRASAKAPWIRLDGFTTAKELVHEYRALSTP